MRSEGYLHTLKKEQCFGCEACIQACPVDAISLKEDEEGFRYPIINSGKCIDCGKCHKVCPYEKMPEEHSDKKYVFGGYAKDVNIRAHSTSGGAFSVIAESWCNENYVIFGAEAKGLEVFHSYITDKKELARFRKSKYSQSVIGSSYKDAKKFLQEGKKVLFSGTPCHIAGLRAFLGNADTTNLLTIEVICEGVPSPLYIRKYDKYIQEQHSSSIRELDYRYKHMELLENPVSGKWDFEAMYTLLQNGKELKKDRWFNPFWSVWLKHLMSRPSCYQCPFAKAERVADISLGDLWGVHLYCPELYGRNGGASLVVCNTEKGKQAMQNAEKNMYGHELEFDTALKYQGPMRKSISENEQRTECMKDLQSSMGYKELNRKWATRPTMKLLFQKYIWGNRQKVWLWNLLHRKEKSL